MEKKPLSILFCEHGDEISENFNELLTKHIQYIDGDFQNIIFSEGYTALQEEYANLFSFVPYELDRLVDYYNSKVSSAKKQGVNIYEHLVDSLKKMEEHIQKHYETEEYYEVEETLYEYFLPAMLQKFDIELEKEEVYISNLPFDVFLDPAKRPICRTFVAERIINHLRENFSDAKHFLQDPIETVRETANKVFSLLNVPIKEMPLFLIVMTNLNGT
jgi:hypothetical protein